VDFDSMTTNDGNRRLKPPTACRDSPEGCCGMCRYQLRRLQLQTVVFCMLGVLTFTVMYHVLILTQIVPYENVWGGRLQSLEAMYRFETVSMVLSLIMIGIVIHYHERCPCRVLPEPLLRTLCWIFCALFALNTLGNMAAKTWFEMVFFTPLTLFMSVSFARFAIEDNVRGYENFPGVAENSSLTGVLWCFWGCPMLVTEVGRNVDAFSKQEMMIIERDISYYQIVTGWRTVWIQGTCIDIGKSWFLVKSIFCPLVVSNVSGWPSPHYGDEKLS